MLACRASASAASLRLVAAAKRHGHLARVWRHWQALAHCLSSPLRGQEQQWQVDDHHWREPPRQGVEGQVLAVEQEEQTVPALPLPQAVGGKRRRNEWRDSVASIIEGHQQRGASEGTAAIPHTPAFV